MFARTSLILTALAIGQVPLINATKRLRFVLAEVVLTLEWASANFQPWLIVVPLTTSTMISSAHGKTKWVVAVKEVSTIRRSVSEEKQNSLRNLKILPGIGILGEFWGSHDVIKSNIWEILDFLRIPKKCGTISEIFRRTFVCMWYCSSSIY